MEQGEGNEKEGSNWETVIDPHLYLLTEWDSNSSPQQQQQQVNIKRTWNRICTYFC